jgi:hypothetical protein
MKAYEEILTSIPTEVSFGYATIQMYRPSELEQYQVGYSVNPAGVSLIGGNNGDWHKEWLVIGHEGRCGDPLFIDVSQDGYPVYTAMHGEGRWDPVSIADSLHDFGHALSAIADIAKGREHPVALKANPLKKEEKEATLATIRRHNPTADLDFWNIFLDDE